MSLDSPNLDTLDAWAYDVKKVEGTGARTAAPNGKTMAVDDWHEASVREGSPALCR